MPVNICAVTSTRADYGIFSPLLRRMDADAFYRLTLVATGAHLLPDFGHTVEEIRQDGFSPVEIPIMANEPDSAAAVSNVMAEALSRFASFFSERAFDLLIVLGDRYEIAAVCCAAVNARLPIAHIHGGETSQGVIDECYRHAITKMSALHFPCCEEYRRRIIQLGEQPDTVFNVGALCVENIRHTEPYPIERLSQELGMPLTNLPYAVVTFHPVTQESGSALTQLQELMRAVDAYDSLHYIITQSNADEGGGEINDAWRAFVQTHENCRLTASLGMTRYLTALKGSRMVIGNSSSGIIEAPVCGVPTVNVGDRQKGRLRAKSILDCKPECDDILRAMRKADGAGFRASLAHIASPYGDGTTSEQIASILKRRLSAPIDTKKVFYDLDFPKDKP